MQCRLDYEISVATLVSLQFYLKLARAKFPSAIPNISRAYRFLQDILRYLYTCGRRKSRIEEAAAMCSAPHMHTFAI